MKRSHSSFIQDTFWKKKQETLWTGFPSSFRFLITKINITNTRRKKVKVATYRIEMFIYSFSLYFSSSQLHFAVCFVYTHIFTFCVLSFNFLYLSMNIYKGLKLLNHYRIIYRQIQSVTSKFSFLSSSILCVFNPKRRKIEKVKNSFFLFYCLWVFNGKKVKKK